MAGQRQALRDRIAELGGPNPPSSATIADLTLILNALEFVDSQPPTAVDRPAGTAGSRPSTRCPAGRNLWTETLCRNCLIRGQTVCPEAD